MIEIKIPGFGHISIEHVVFDYNGTIALDGNLIQGVKEKINKYSSQLRFHVITADTFGSVKKQLQDVDAVLTIISNEKQDQKKLDYIKKLGASKTISVGNGINDRLMLEKSRIGISVIGEEGLASSSFLASNLLVKNILDVFGFFKTPERLIASMRK